MNESLHELGLWHEAPAVILALVGLMTLAGYYFGGLARRVRLPSLIGYMVLGVILGPSLVGWLPHAVSDKLAFITQIALGFVAISIGSELSVTTLKRLGAGIISIIFAESLAAFLLVFLAVYLYTRSWPMALIFGAVAPASAPAGTVAVIQEYKAKGNLTKALYAVVGFDDGLAIVIFGFAAAMAKVLLVSTFSRSADASVLAGLLVPLKEIVFSLGLGAAIGFVFCQLVRPLRNSRDMLIVLFGTVLLATGLAEHFHLSLILTNMVVGFVLVNTRRSALVHRVTAPLQDVMPLLFVLFFCLAGSHLEVRQLLSLGVVGALYILARSGGKIIGAAAGAKIGNVEEKIRRYLGLGILSQAGVAIGLSLIIRHEFMMLAEKHHADIDAFAQAHPELSLAMYDPSYIAGAVITTITATCIFFEIVGPVCTKIALDRAGEIPSNT